MTMSHASLDLRPSSYVSLQQIQNRKASNTLISSKEKDDLFIWIYKFALRKKLGMLLVCFVSIAVMLWIVYIGKGEVTQAFGPIRKLGFINTSPVSVDEVRTQEYNHSIMNDDIKINISNYKISTAQPPPTYFTGYALPPGNPCETFTLPPPPADKKRTGPRPCPVCYFPVEEAITLMPKYPTYSPVIQNLTYIHEEKSAKSEFGGSVFGGYPSLNQRLESYEVKESMTVHCGFVTGDKPGRKTGFDIDDSDLFEMDQCRGVLVASAIFGAYDLIQQPKNISEVSKQNVCFFMFVDEQTETFLKNSSNLDDSKRIGLWRIVVVHNLPYTDPRRNGKVPKLLLHRLFPNVRYSLWVDGKLELVVDPYQILERFLWRKNASLAISRHYKRFDVFVEAEANKAARKYDNASIDFQIDFYKREGLTSYSMAKLPITSDVPEGCVVIREHIPISNLFTCLWFNEVDRFTSRDQISFSTVRDKIMSKTNWTVDMFWDCERRNFVVQGYHRDILEHWAPPPPGTLVVTNPSPPLPIQIDETPKIIISNPTKIPIIKRRRDRKSSRQRKVVTSTGDSTTQSQSQSPN